MSTTANFNTFTLPQLTDLIDRKFNENLENMQWQLRKAPFVREDSLPYNTGVYTRYAESIDMNQYASRRAEWDQAVQAVVQYGYEKDLQVEPFAQSLGVTQLMLKTNKGGQLERQIEDLTRAVPNRIELDLAHRFTFFSSTSYVDRDGVTVSITVGDGLALGSASHTLTGSSTTYSNIITGNPQFSEGALEAGEKSMIENSYNNLGEKVALSPDVILTTDDANTCNQVRKLMNATADVSTSNSGTFNVYKNKYQHVVSNRIATTATGAVDTTKAKYWFLIASKNSDMYLTMLEQPYYKAPKAGGNGEDISTETVTHLVGGIWGICIVTPKWIRCSNGTGA